MHLFSGFFEGTEKAKDLLVGEMELGVNIKQQQRLFLSKPEAESRAFWFKC